MSRERRIWQRRAEALAKAFPRERLHPRVVEWVARRTMASRGAWSLALSGGADSLALVLLVWAHWPEQRRRMTVLHFDHRQRGKRAAGADVRFCREVASGLGLRSKVGVWKEAKQKATEAELRGARMRFFSDAMARNRSRVLWSGHQQEDIAETMLMRLARGSGTAGLAAPRPLQYGPEGRWHLRPLLTLGKAEVKGALEKLGIPWMEDASNVGGQYLRNRVRNSVIPAWQEAVAGRNVFAGAALARERLEEDDDALEAWLDMLGVLGRGPVLRVTELGGKPVALCRRALHRWLAATPYRGDLSRQGFDALLAALCQGESTRMSLGNEGFAVLAKGELRYRKTRKRAQPKNTGSAH